MKNEKKQYSVKAGERAGRRRAGAADDLFHESEQNSNQLPSQEWVCESSGCWNYYVGRPGVSRVHIYEVDPGSDLMMSYTGHPGQYYLKARGEGPDAQTYSIRDRRSARAMANALSEDLELGGHSALFTEDTPEE